MFRKPDIDEIKALQELIDNLGKQEQNKSVRAFMFYLENKKHDLYWAPNYQFDYNKFADSDIEMIREWYEKYSELAELICPTSIKIKLNLAFDELSAEEISETQDLNEMFDEEISEIQELENDIDYINSKIKNIKERDVDPDMRVLKKIESLWRNAIIKTNQIINSITDKDVTLEDMKKLIDILKKLDQSIENETTAFLEFRKRDLLRDELTDQAAIEDMEKEFKLVNIADKIWGNSDQGINRYQGYVNLKSGLKFITEKADRMEFDIACNELKAATDIKKKSNELYRPIKEAGRQVLYAARTSVQEGKTKPEDISFLTKCLRGTKEIINDPIPGPGSTEKRTKSYRTHDMNLQEALERKIDGSIRKGLWGVLLCAAGIGLIVTAGLVAWATYGISAPLSIKAMALGGGLVASGLMIAASALAGTSLAVSSSFYARNNFRGDIASAMKDVKVEAKKISKNSI